VTPLKDAPGDHVPGQIPSPPGGREVVIDHSSGPGSGVKDTIVTNIDGDMVDLSASARKEQQVAGLERFDIEWRGTPCRGQ
jgi:hypothetical protein